MIFKNSVSNPSGMLIPDPDFCPSRIPDLGSRTQKQQQKRGMKKKLVVLPFFCSHKYHKIENYCIFELVKKKIGAYLQRIIEFLPKL